jgi:hypothetical protein
MEELLNPASRVPKMFLVQDDIIVDVVPELKIGDITTGLTIRIPKGFPAVALNSLRYKDLIQDMVLLERHPDKLDAKYQTLLTPAQYADLKSGLKELRARLLKEREKFVMDITGDPNTFVQRYYSNVLDRIENKGHRFGEDLSPDDKKALIAFLATL